MHKSSSKKNTNLLPIDKKRQQGMEVEKSPQSLIRDRRPRNIELMKLYLTHPPLWTDEPRPETARKARRMLLQEVNERNLYGKQISKTKLKIDISSLLSHLSKRFDEGIIHYLHSVEELDLTPLNDFLKRKALYRNPHEEKWKGGTALARIQKKAEEEKIQKEKKERIQKEKLERKKKIQKRRFIPSPFVQAVAACSRDELYQEGEPDDPPPKNWQQQQQQRLSIETMEFEPFGLQQEVPARDE